MFSRVPRPAQGFLCPTHWQPARQTGPRVNLCMPFESGFNMIRHCPVDRHQGNAMSYFKALAWVGLLALAAPVAAPAQTLKLGPAA